MATEFIQTRLGASHVRPQPPPVRHPAARAPSRPSPARAQPITHLLIFCPSASLLETLFLHPLQRHQHKYPQLPQTLVLSQTSSQDSPLSQAHLRNSPVPLLRSTYTARRYLSRRSLKTPSTLLQNPFPKVTPVPPSLCPSKISRPTVRFSLDPSPSSIGRKPSDLSEATQPQKPTRVYLHLLMPSHMLPTPPNPHARTDGQWKQVLLTALVNRPLRRSRRGHRRNQADAELHPYTHSA